MVENAEEIKKSSTEASDMQKHSTSDEKTSVTAAEKSDIASKIPPEESLPVPPTPASISSKKTVVSANSDNKVRVHFVAVGSAPIMKKTKFKIDADQQFAYVMASLRRTLKLADDSADALFLYCHSAFVPSPDQRLGDLNECFSVRGELVIHYCLKEAWG
eukprot:CAMPEP_0195520784 /NCGR_PEP_ID=MMETSP0794_2-20130614/17542_1 /TAXON_ID=515487 /ORGANISM="Stephanopyxis turris, Strain CCMP 815" /LENGTH=159 /DNA_ID=CAMNT_0040650207 /DNA_START=333 /DNA_END=812 /DNA_ORIENTATION=+